MTTQWRYLTWYPLYPYNQTHLIDDITPYVCMKSHPLHVWLHRHFIWPHIHSCWQHTIVCMSWHTLCLWHQVYYIWYHLYRVYDYTTSISDLKPVKTAISSTLYVITPSLSRHHTYCVRLHRWHMYAIICVKHDIISTLYDNNPYYLWYHMHYIHYITHIIYDISFTLFDVTFTMCVTSFNDSIYDIKPHMFMPYSLCMESRTVLWPHCNCVPSQPLGMTLHSVYFWHYTQCNDVMKRSVCMSSHPLYVRQNMHYIWHHIHSLWYHTMLWYSHTLYSCHQTQDKCHRIQCCWALSYSILNITHLQYVFPQTHYIYDII